MKDKRRIRYRPVYLVMVMGLILRITGIGQSFWLDEATSGLVARDLSVNEIMSVFIIKDFHPPLYYIALKAWAGVFGSGEVALRMLSVGWGLGVVAVTYLIARRMFDRATAMLAGILTATSPLLVYYSQEARMYIMAAFWVTVSVYYYLKAVKGGDRINYVAMGAALTVVFLTDYLAALIVVVIGVDFFRRKGWKKEVRKFAQGIGILGIAVTVYLPVLREQFGNAMGVKEGALGWWERLGQTNLKNVMLIPVKFLIGRIGFDSMLGYVAVVLVAGGVAGFLMLKTLGELKKTAFFWKWLFMPLVISLVLGMFIPVVSYFRLIFSLPAMYLIIAYGAQKVSEEWYLPAIVLLVVMNLSFCAVFFSGERFQRENWRGMVEYVEAQSEGKESRVIFVNNGQMEAVRYYNLGISFMSPDGVDGKAEKLWLMRYVWDVFDPGDQVRARVEELGYERVAEHNFNGVVVWEYENRN